MIQEHFHKFSFAPLKNIKQKKLIFRIHNNIVFHGVSSDIRNPSDLPARVRKVGGGREDNTISYYMCVSAGRSQNTTIGNSSRELVRLGLTRQFISEVPLHYWILDKEILKHRVWYTGCWTRPYRKKSFKEIFIHNHCRDGWTCRREIILMKRYLMKITQALIFGV